VGLRGHCRCSPVSQLSRLEHLPAEQPGDDEYQIVFSFDHASSLERWQNSEERRRWNEWARDLIHEEPRIRVLTGLETWFTLPSREGAPPPPRYKMAIITWLAVFPLATVLFMLLNPLLGGPPWCCARWCSQW